MTQATTPPFQPQAFAAAEGLARQRAWVDVDPGAITANARSLRRCLAPTTNLMAVVKADGYGHGAVPVARAAAAAGASCFGVATLGEGLELRQAGLREPVLVLGNLIQPETFRDPASGWVNFHGDAAPFVRILEVSDPAPV